MTAMPHDGTPTTTATGMKAARIMEAARSTTYESLFLAPRISYHSIWSFSRFTVYSPPPIWFSNFRPISSLHVRSGGATIARLIQLALAIRRAFDRTFLGLD